MKKKNQKKNLNEGRTTAAINSEVASGFRYLHARTTFNTKKVMKSSAFLYALIELLDEKKMVPIEELDERMRKVADRLVKKFEESRVGLLYQDPEEDKYAFDKNPGIDCGDRLKACKAICCKIPFALSRQDVEEGVVRWEFGRPYLIAHGNDGYCVHLDRKTYQCAIYDQRPVPCRGFDCRENKQWPVWTDFNNKRMNNKFTLQVSKSCEKMYQCP